MVFNLNVLNKFQQNKNTISLLESLPYIEREFVDPTPSSIPLMELEDHPDVHFVRYSDLEHLAEVKDITIHEAATTIQKANLLPARRFVVAMEEWRPLLDPSIIDEFPNVILIREVNTPIYQFCEDCMNAFMQTRDESYVDLFLEIPGPLMEYTEAQLDKYMQAVQKQHPNWDYDQVYNHAYRTLQAFDKKDDAMASLKQKTETQTSDGTPQSTSPKPDPTQQSQQPPPQQQQEQQGWWARKWTAFKNWMNNLGSNGDQKSTWFTNLTNKVKSFFNGGAKATQAANQQQQAQQNTTNQPTSSGSGGTSTGNQTANQQQQAQQNTTNQPTSSGSGGTRNIGVDIVTSMAGQQVMNKSSQFVDSLVGKTNEVLKDKFGLDLSPLTAMVGEFGKAYVNQKISQGMEHVKDTGGNLVNTGMNQVGNAVKQGYQNAKAAITGGS